MPRALQKLISLSAMEARVGVAMDAAFRLLIPAEVRAKIFGGGAPRFLERANDPELAVSPGSAPSYEARLRAAEAMVAGERAAQRERVGELRNLMEHGKYIPMFRFASARNSDGSGGAQSSGDRNNAQDSNRRST